MYLIYAYVYFFGYYYNSLQYAYRKNVELKKVNSKHIFKSTLTPQMQRKSTSMDNGINNKVFSPTLTTGKLNRRDNASIYIILGRLININKTNH